MKLIINKNQIRENPAQFLRRAGYAFITDHRTGKESFVRRLTRDFYPRLHMYVEHEAEKISFNLHLDQKKASYKGAHMHNAEYDGQIVGGEIERLRSLLGPVVAEKNDQKDISGNIFDKLGEGKLERSEEKEIEKKGFWSKLFG